ncbi:MAG: 1-deoxy-D-xylulose-5-phosphate reductoisomerase [candidate division WOR-3 bacterium]|nr:MAG: 1-deoxy-D-xylulose-5-phosphate reductoisomerase [candidate division WOR-3 bacterium]
MNKVIILGSTGSIGCNAIEVIKGLKDHRIVGLAAYGNYRRLGAQAAQLKPLIVTLVTEKHRGALRKDVGRAKLYCGEDGIEEMIDRLNADTIICAMSSSIGIRGVMRAIEKKMKICLATKEILVNFGSLVMKKARRMRAQIIPIDSEHSAIYQCLEGKNRADVLNIILTASGGPFFKRSLENVKKKDVLNHPVWKMGRKITVDSATMMNKGLEVIEAYHLFDFPVHMIKVVVHPQAICHSIVQFKDGTALAQLSTPDMRLPIQYALTAPNRLRSAVPYLDIARAGRLTFVQPDFRKFRCLSLAYKALEMGRTMPAVLNTANEEAVKLFLNDKIKFLQIPGIIEKVISKHQPRDGNLECYLQATAWAKERVRSLVC